MLLAYGTKADIKPRHPALPHNAHNSGQPKAGPVACAGYGATCYESNLETIAIKNPALGGAL